MKVVRIAQGKAVPLPFRFAGTLVILMLFVGMHAYLAMHVFVLMAMVVSSLLPALWSSVFILEIDPANHIIHEYVWVMGRKFGKKRPLPPLGRIYVNQVKTSRHMHSYGGSTLQLKGYECVGFLKFSNEETLELIREEDCEFVVKSLSKIAKKLDIPFKFNDTVTP
ncbi:MAG: hypothetical protein OEY56_09125 [Cyclobacteriaceae bacterium]|nr:hypothetical protein [Cyclobacteriaceae bacterium]